MPYPDAVLYFPKPTPESNTLVGKWGLPEVTLRPAPEEEVLTEESTRSLLRESLAVVAEVYGEDCTVLRKLREILEREDFYGLQDWVSKTPLSDPFRSVLRQALEYLAGKGWPDCSEDCFRRSLEHAPDAESLRALLRRTPEYEAISSKQ